jgi:hypothetical protein
MGKHLVNETALILHQSDNIICFYFVVHANGHLQHQQVSPDQFGRAKMDSLGHPYEEVEVEQVMEQRMGQPHLEEGEETR